MSLPFSQPEYNAISSGLVGMKTNEQKTNYPASHFFNDPDLVLQNN